jgi:hypothetical protein
MQLLCFLNNIKLARYLQTMPLSVCMYMEKLPCGTWEVKSTEHLACQAGNIALLRTAFNAWAVLQDMQGLLLWQVPTGTCTGCASIRTGSCVCPCTTHAVERACLKTGHAEAVARVMLLLPLLLLLPGAGLPAQSWAGIEHLEPVQLCERKQQA